MVCTFFYFCLPSYSVFLKYHLSVDYFITVHLYVAFLLFISNQTSTQSYEFPPCCKFYHLFLFFFMLILIFMFHFFLSFFSPLELWDLCMVALFRWWKQGMHMFWLLFFSLSPSFCLSFTSVFIHPILPLILSAEQGGILFWPYSRLSAAATRVHVCISTVWTYVKIILWWYNATFTGLHFTIRVH